MDFAGQRLSEQLYEITVLLFALVGFFGGWMLGSFRLLLLLYAAGVALAFVIAVPDWPYFNQTPLAWLPAVPPSSVPPPAAGGKGGAGGGSGARGTGSARAGGSEREGAGGANGSHKRR